MSVGEGRGLSGQPLVAAVNDLSGFGRCSLTAAIPVLSAMGCQVCPLPTALLSAHTGYPDPYIYDFTEHMAGYLAHWQRLGLRFSAVFTGFLGSEEQAALLEPFVQAARQDGALTVVDPAMADHGRLYSTCTPALARAMRRLLGAATVTTPNLTEACLLTDTDFSALSALPDEARRPAIEAVGQRLLALGCRAAVITGIPEGGCLVNGVFAHGRPAEWLRVKRVARSFAGTGDVFSAVLCGEMLRLDDLHAAVERAAAFVYRAAAYTAAADAPEQGGIMFEPFLGELVRKEEKG